MKLHMMTHGDPQQYEEDAGNVVPMFHNHNSSPFYHIGNSYDKGSYSGKYYNSPVNSMPDNRYNNTSQSNSRETAETYSSECDATNMTNDDLLLRVAEEQLRPLIKEELRYTIQSKRAAKGLPSHVEIEYKVAQPEPETPAMSMKRQRRRDRNKIAAAKCRFKKKILSEKLLEESDHLETQNHKLKTEVQRLQDERQKLIYILNLHRPTCIVRSPSCSSPTNEECSTSSSPGFSQTPTHGEHSKNCNGKLSLNSRSSSLEDDAINHLTSTFTFPPFSTGNESINTPIHRSVIVRSDSMQASS
ncbi:uncharacterized protein LOC120326432 [Styela clava]